MPTPDFQVTLIQATDDEFRASLFAAGAPVALSFPQAGTSFAFPTPTQTSPPTAP
ncbi:hypothetical protein C8Q76DRAFT_796785 [Earliella scabrosa]|nr:hypothetical protein C8Q76DRAFT_796785 [Earliella scabrosa]